MKYYYTIMAQMCTGLALFAMLEGMAWIDKGYGLHPMLAGALATAALLTPHLVAKRVLA